MANKSFPDFAGNPDTVLTTPAPTDQVLIWDNSEPLDINKVKVISYQNLVNLAAQSAIQALVSGQAAGDTFYATSATALARLAKGTAGQVWRMNAGATAPEWGYSGGVVKRQGGSTTIWSTPGTTNYVPTASKIQAGVIAIALTDDDESVNITFPEAFTYAPIALCHISGGTGTSYVRPVTTEIYNITTTGMTISIKAGGSSDYTFYVHWVSIGV